MAAFITLEKIVNTLKSQGKYHIVFLGDSITSAEYIHPNFREIIEYVLKEDLCKLMGEWKTSSWGIRCFNAGFDGGTTRDMLDKIDEYVVKPDPDLVICCASGNDKTFKIPLEEHKSNIQKIADIVTNTDAKLVFCTSPASLDYKTDSEYEDYAKTVASVFPQDNSLFINLYEDYKSLDLSKMYTFISEGNEVTGVNPGEADPDHPSHLGNAYMAKILLQRTFGVNFDPEKFVSSTRNGEKYPKY